MVIMRFLPPPFENSNGNQKNKHKKKHDVDIQEFESFDPNFFLPLKHGAACFDFEIQILHF